MKSCLECVPCLMRQAIESTARSIIDEKKREKMVRRLLRVISRMDFNEPPPVAALKIHRLLRGRDDSADPYREAKDRFNAMALDILPSFMERIALSADPFAAALCLAVAGNVIDLGVKGDLSEDEAFSAVMRAFDETLIGDIGEFRTAVETAERILYLADNAGEIVFDAALIRMLPAGRVTVVVRGYPVINDATIADAIAAGIPDIARVIDNGSDAPGTVLADCSPAFIAEYRKADLVISKGQGNFETLSGENKAIFFLFKVKCPVVAAHSGMPIGAHVLLGAGIFN